MWPFSNKADPDAARASAVDALKCQTDEFDALCARAEREPSDVLEGTATLALLFGFVDFFAQEHGVRQRQARVNVAISVFRDVFGDQQGIRMFGALQEALKASNSSMWTEEGFNAARYFKADGLKLVREYFKAALG